MAKETKRFDVHVINPNGVEATMTIMERDGALILWNGLDQRRLSLPENWTAQDIEQEVKRLSGATRLVLI